MAFLRYCNRQPFGSQGIIIVLACSQKFDYIFAMQSFKQRIYPNQEQREYLCSAFGANRFVYNWALHIKTEEWANSKKRVSAAELGRRLTQLKQTDNAKWLKKESSRCLFFTLMNLETAFSKFFRNKSKYPKFKKRKDFGGSAKYDIEQFKLKDGKLQLPKLKSLIRVNWTRDLPCPPKFVTVSQDSCGDYWASFTCDYTPGRLDPIQSEVGIDLGISAFATLSTGEKVLAPDLRRKTERVRILQCRAARKQKGSCNCRKAKRRVARAYRKVANTRKDFHHKFSRKLVNENQVIALEDLAVRNMTKNRHLARSISEQGWTEFVGMLEYKAEWAGRTVVRVDRFFPSSKTCSSCGFVVEKLPLNIRAWNCPHCGIHHDRDVNAAINILAAGRAVSACGVDGRPTAGYRQRHSTVKQAATV